MAEIRTFVAVKIDERIREAISQIQKLLRQGGSRVKWVEPHNLHITLKFLGDIKEDNLSLYYQALEKGVEDFSSFTLTFQGLGAFPSLKRPRVLWVGVKEGGNQLSALSKAIATSLVQASLIDEKELKNNRFSPHLTLGRIRSQKGLGELLKLVKENENFQGGTMEVNQVHFIKSTLTTKGPNYSVLKRLYL